MAPSTTVCALAVVVLATTLSVVESVTCYSCTDCNTVSSSTATCNGTYCAKVYASAGGVTSTARTCVPTAADGCVHVSNSAGSGDFCYCQSDLCNTATQRSPSGITLVAVTGLVVAMFMVNRQ